MRVCTQPILGAAKLEVHIQSRSVYSFVSFEIETDFVVRRHRKEAGLETGAVVVSKDSTTALHHPDPFP